MESKPTSNIVAIAPLVVNVVRSFKVLSTALQSKPASEVVGNTPDRTRNVGRYQLLIAHAVKVDEELGRFRVWAGNISAHRTGRRSLEYRLRDASNLRQRVLGLLEALQIALTDGAAISSDQKVPWDREVENDESDSDSDLELHENDQSTQRIGGAPDTELGQIVDDVREIVTCLMRFSMTLRNPARHDQLREAAFHSTSHYESFDIDHVRAKFPSAPEFLVARLGKAISHRRQYFKYRESHHLTLAEGIDLDKAPKSIRQSTVATLPLIEPQEGQVSELRDDGSDSGITQTSFAGTEIGAMTLRPPPLPKAGEGGTPFECPMCFTIVSIGDSNAWRRHVYEDLPPYICTYEDCVLPHQQYPRRRQWHSHELKIHRKVWHCCFGCQDVFQSRTKFEQHLSVHHKDSFEANSFDELQNLWSTPAEDGSYLCPLCQKKLNSAKRLTKHVGHHQEQLALFALPKSLMTSASDDERDDDEARDIDDQDFSEEHASQISEPLTNFERGAPLHVRSSSHGTDMSPPQTPRSGNTRRPPALRTQTQTQQDEQDAVAALIGLQSPHSSGQLANSGLETSRPPDHATRGVDQIATDVSQLRLSLAAELTERAAKAEEEAEKAKMESDKILNELKKKREELEAEVEKDKPTPDSLKAPIKFKDAVGRKFSFPWHLCKTWKGMEGLIRQAFVHVDIIGQHVQEGHYDLTGPDGEIILPQVWDTMIQPDWEVSMHMWPMPEPEVWDAEGERRISEYQNKKSKEAEEAKAAEIAAIEKFDREKQKAEEREQREYEEFLQKQQAMKENKERERKTEEDNTEQAMRERLRKYGYAEGHINAMVKAEKETTITPVPVYAKVHHDFLSTETLAYYDIPYEYDRNDPDYIIILREMDKHETEVLFEHTRRTRGKTLLSKEEKGKKP